MSDSPVPAQDLRSRFSQAMSTLYMQEVPPYATLTGLVETVNQRVLRERDDPRADDAGEVAAISAQRHGAIRVGKPEELAFLCRLFALFDMQPVDFYDLVPAGLPVYSTAFRPVDTQSLESSPFRIFCSLLRPELIQDQALREEVIIRIASREIASPRLVELLANAEERGGVSPQDADEFIDESIRIFRWTGEARVEAAQYERFLASHRLIADIAAFRGPHINHLTPSALDIDALQAELGGAGLSAKATIEGPPRRACPILLRQTAFNAVAEDVRFPAAEGTVSEGSHTARFGEVEQRGAALTPKGRALYDRCLERAQEHSAKGDYEAWLVEAFSEFPDDWPTLLAQDLVYFRYRIADGRDPAGAASLDLDDHAVRADAVARGVLDAEPIRYEDFLPVSAAGIFRSNLGNDTGDHFVDASSQVAFEEALGRTVIDPHVLYEKEQQDSIDALRFVGW